MGLPDNESGIDKFVCHITACYWTVDAGLVVVSGSFMFWEIWG